ncbi:hypothetical protein I3843_01G228500 [Carya illinoinensis]|uniref:Pectinesterase inhibitor domain-containing protein n=1 Tax=Carya illinoinensis TaxID=32201 RepID=A0A8T1RRF6_CARIL|nr:hypothetical protein CIPAW_01G236600 [Carya illinoinensis]KAG6733714.1 hypothetical protein I3842_01G237900 [Carya illinoinensis]KAG7997820.1 hypothetical protein I3843_01G228500 [Carya illinoinensis]
MGIKNVVSLPLCLPMISIVLFCVLISTQHCAAATANQNGESLIKKTCKQTEFPDVCSSTLESDPRSSNAVDVRGLSRIGLELVFTKGEETVKVAHDLVIQIGIGYDTWARRAGCMSSYNLSIHNVKEKGLPNFDAKRYKDAYQILENAWTEIHYCSTLNVPELAERNTIMTKFLTALKTILHLLF